MWSLWTLKHPVSEQELEFLATAAGCAACPSVDGLASAWLFADIDLALVGTCQWTGQRPPSLCVPPAQCQPGLFLVTCSLHSLCHKAPRKLRMRATKEAWRMTALNEMASEQYRSPVPANRYCWERKTPQNSVRGRPQVSNEGRLPPRKVGRHWAVPQSIVDFFRKDASQGRSNRWFLLKAAGEIV